jgi:hypothetical protein
MTFVGKRNRDSKGPMHYLSTPEKYHMLNKNNGLLFIGTKYFALL